MGNGGFDTCIGHAPGSIVLAGLRKGACKRLSRPAGTTAGQAGKQQGVKAMPVPAGGKENIAPIAAKKAAIGVAAVDVCYSAACDGAAFLCTQ
jgi:hypothetical protein